MLDDVEQWVTEHYGEITTSEVDFPQFGWKVVSAVVPLYESGIAIGMGMSRQLAIHDLYLDLVSHPTLKTSLPPFWQRRRSELTGEAAARENPRG